jgi:DNA-binding LacI/PurR family transcriptional regulator
MRPPKPTVTLRQIAAAAGVSHTAVSMALRNDPSVSEATRKRICKIARSLGYRPDPFVAALLARVRTGRSPQLQAKLAFVDPAADRQPWADAWTNRKFRAGAAARAGELGFELEDFHPLASRISYSRLSDILWSRGIRGIVLGVFDHYQQGAIDMKWERFAAATQGYSVIEPELHRSCHFHWNGMIQACTALHDLGYRRLGFAFTERASWRVRHLWLGAYQAFHAARGFPCLPPHLDPGPDLDRQAFLRWRESQKPDAILTIHPEIADWLRAAGCRIPHDVALAHVDRHEEALPNWAGIDQNAHAVGARAAELVIEQLRNNDYGVPKHPKVVLTHGAWIAGQSIRPKRKLDEKTVDCEN